MPLYPLAREGAMAAGATLKRRAVDMPGARLPMAANEFTEIVMRSFILAAALLSLGWASEAAAQSRCRVMDPTGTPLNIRSGPNGRIVGTLENGLLVTVLDRAADGNGKPWVYIANFQTGAPLGWVFREFIACF